MISHITPPALLLAVATALAGCGRDQPEPPRENFGGGLGKSYNEMLDQARQGVDDANRQMQETDRRARDAGQ